MHDDVRKALEMAENALHSALLDRLSPNAMLRAAVLALVKAMPDWEPSEDAPIWTPSRIAAELEKDTPNDR